MKLRNAGIVLVLLLANAVAASSGLVDSAGLMHLARQFVAASLPPASGNAERTVRVSAPDPRLQLSPCPQAPVAFWPNNARQTGTTVVGIRCPISGGWQLFLPVQIQETVTVLVASRPLRPGERLQSADMQTAAVSRDQLRGNSFADPKALLGAVTRQAIAAGQPLTDALTCQVCRGDPVTIAAGDGSFEVRMKGIAEGSGHAGDRLPVRNQSSRRTIQAIVVSDGAVRVAL